MLLRLNLSSGLSVCIVGDRSKKTAFSTYTLLSWVVSYTARYRSAKVDSPVNHENQSRESFSRAQYYISDLVEKCLHLWHLTNAYQVVYQCLLNHSLPSHRGNTVLMCCLAAQP